MGEPISDFTPGIQRCQHDRTAEALEHCVPGFFTQEPSEHESTQRVRHKMEPAISLATLAHCLEDFFDCTLKTADTRVISHITDSVTTSLNAPFKDQHFG